MKEPRQLNNQKEPRQLNNQAEAELAELRARGIAVTDADVVLLNALCWEIESPSNRVELARGRPLRVGGVWLWPRTIAALQWYQDVGCECGDGHAAMAYCMANGRGEIETSTEKDVEEWAKKLTCTRAELNAAFLAIIDQEETDELPPPENEPDATLGQLVQVMHATHGGDVAMWERYVSFGYVLDMLTTASAQSEADGGQTAAIRARGNLALAYAIHKIETREPEGATHGES